MRDSSLPPSIIRDLNLDIDSPEAEPTFKALSNGHRLRILKFLEAHASTVAQISEKLELPISTANQHLKVLEEAGLIQTEIRPASRGTEKVCSAVYRKVICDLFTPTTHNERAVEISMPIGAYTHFEVSRPCGLCSPTKMIGFQGDPEAFFEPERVDAQLLWFATGFVEYHFPKRLPPRTKLESLYLSMEICSEAPGFNMDWPSDITVWVNDKEIGTWTSPSDFGDQRGLLTPNWWASNNTQYGTVKSWQVNQIGGYVDGLKISDIVISDLEITSRSYISVKIGVKESATHQGGINLFGRAFGNYPQDLVMRLIYEDM